MTPARALALALVLSAATARGDFVRSAIKIDVRDQKGTPQLITVSVRGAGGAMPTERVGEVYVASGLVEGEYVVRAESMSKLVRVRGRLGGAIVFVLGKSPSVVALASGDLACDGDDGVVVEAVVFQRGGALGAGRLDVKNARGRLVCSAIVAGGSVALRLRPGEYEVGARLVGGAIVRERYSLGTDGQAPPLVLRAR